MRYILIFLLMPLLAEAQDSATIISQNKTYYQNKSNAKGSFYFSWGYNSEDYSRSKVKVKQPEYGNDYTLANVKGEDHPGWDHGLLNKPISIPQYNYRLGYFFNNDRDLGVELNFDHTKFIITDGQSLRIKGKLNGEPVDSTIIFSESYGFYYYLNNGANFLLVNLVKRFHFCNNKKGNIDTDILAKCGFGPVIPHVENSFFGKKNNPHFQFGGWNTGIETAIRTTFYHHVYIEFAGKLDYARYSHLHIDEGNVSHAFATGELILNLGLTFNSGHKK